MLAQQFQQYEHSPPLVFAQQTKYSLYRSRSSRFVGLGLRRLTLVGHADFKTCLHHTSDR